MRYIREIALGAAILVGAVSAVEAQQSGAAAAGIPVRKDTVRSSPHSADGTAPAGPGEVKVNQFMSYDPSAKTVSISLIASYNSTNGGMNFNGGARGDQTITVPQGWSVKMVFVNEDAIPHSAIILPDKLPFPAAPENPAIPGAYTNDVTAGMPPKGTDTMNFKTSNAGDYLIVCGVPGHGPSGMYIKFVVSANAKAPSYAMKG